MGIQIVMPMDRVQKQCLPYLGNRLRASLNIACSKKTSSRLLLLQSMSCCSGVDDVSLLKRNKHQCALLPENCYQLLEDVTVVGFDTSQIFSFITVGSRLRSSFEKTRTTWGLLGHLVLTIYSLLILSKRCKTRMCVLLRFILREWNVPTFCR